jgi:hypothetical protein
MIPYLNYYPDDEENYTTEQPSVSSFLAGIFSTHDQTNSYRTYDQINSYPTYDQTNSYPTYDRTNSYLYPVIYNNNIIYQQPNSEVLLFNFFGDSSSTTFGCNLADNIGRTEEQYNINGRNSVDPTVIK